MNRKRFLQFISIIMFFTIIFCTLEIKAAGPTINITGVTDGTVYNSSVLPVISVSDPNATVTKTLNGKYYYDTTIYLEGSYILVVTAKDASGNFTTKSVGFTIDKTPPAITITNVVHGGKYKNSVTPIISIGEASVTVTKTLNNQPYNDSLISENGNYTLTVTAIDRANNSTTKTLNFTIDKTAPIITLTGITDGNIYNTDVKALISVDDPNARINATINDFYYSNGEAVTQNGFYVLRITATDELGNQTTKRLSFTIDKKLPTIEIKNVIDAGRYNGSVLPNVVVGDKEAKVTMTLNGVPYNGGYIRNDGDYTLIVSATDKAGNSNSQKVNFTIDRKGPVVKVENIINGGYYSANLIPQITVTDVFPKYTVKLNGKVYDGLPISDEGEYTLEILAKDDLGNPTSVKLRFYIDTTKPKVEVSNIVQNGKYNYSITPDVKNKDLLSKITMKLNGKEYKNEPIEASGNYKLEIEAVDKAGNTEKVIYDFSINKTPPVITISNVEDGMVYKNVVNPDISTSNESDKVRYYLNGKKYNLTPINQDGSYNLKVKAVDDYGNATEVSVNFLLKRVNMAATSENYIVLGVLATFALICILLSAKLVKQLTHRKVIRKKIKKVSKEKENK